MRPRFLHCYGDALITTMQGTVIKGKRSNVDIRNGEIGVSYVEINSV